MVTGLLIVAGARIAAGPFGWRDVAVVALLLAVFPVTEWAIHVYLLHARPPASAAGASTCPRPVSTAPTTRRPRCSTGC